jgi:hypothetical protein
MNMRITNRSTNETTQVSTFLNFQEGADEAQSDGNYNRSGIRYPFWTKFSQRTATITDRRGLLSASWTCTMNDISVIKGALDLRFAYSLRRLHGHFSEQEVWLSSRGRALNCAFLAVVRQDRVESFMLEIQKRTHSHHQETRHCRSWPNRLPQERVFERLSGYQ